MAIDPNNFLHSLAKMIASAAAINYDSGTPRQLCRNQVIFETDGMTDAESRAHVATGLTMYPGAGRKNDPLPRMSVQCLSIGLSADAVNSRAQKCFESLLNSDRSPMRMKLISGYKAADNSADGHWMIVSVDPVSWPGLVGVDDKGLVNVAFSFDVGFFKED